MKNLKKSFLFFTILFYFSSYSQQAIDSTNYYLTLLQYPEKNKDLSGAYKYIQLNQKLTLKNKDTLKAIYNLYLLANIEFKIGLYSESEQTAIAALKLQNSISSNIYQITLYNHLGKINRLKKDYNTAIRYYEKLSNLLKENMLNEKMALHNNLGVLYTHKKEYNKAIRELNKAFNLSLKIKDSLKIAKSLDNLGYTQSKLKIDSGLINMKKALKFRKFKQKSILIYTSISHIFNYYFDNNNNDKALEYAKKGYLLSKKINIPKYKLNALNNFVKLKKEKYFLDYINLKDSIDNLEQAKRRKFISAKYNYTQEQLKAKDSELKAEKQKKLKLLYQSIGAFIFLLSIGGYFFYREKNKKKIVENVIKTEGRISKTVHDVIANDIYQVMSKIQSTNNITDEILDDLDEVYNKARNISRDNYVINNEMNFLEILNDLFDSYRTNKTSIASQANTVDWKGISIHKKNMLYRVLKELMTNMSKYSQATLVTIAFKKNGKKLEILYKDNGIGSVLSKKNGLLNVENRIESINGKITFESEPSKGFKTKITV
ncbi:hypothetical protein [uncultured Tenacibaculum sp.]|uniref:ATP-binding protein n=1 Tax=uncultured Tenacibaculum sp. TaxID=174713 RepID=UPI00261896FE|nr:hypothetical protein [uncultured Tenacibaculum sp.]